MAPTSSNTIPYNGIATENRSDNSVPEIDGPFITSRTYQLELFEMAKLRNIIVCLPTGSGKTWISLLLSKHYYAECQKTGQKIVFLANTVQLVEQQYHYFCRHFPSEHVDYFIGAMDVDSWRGTEKWQEKLRGKYIFVMSTQILYDILNIELSFKDMALIVFDECHHARKKHAMKRIMDLHNQLVKIPNYPLPRVLGLTACVAPSSKKGEGGLRDQMEDLERTMCSRAVTSVRCEEVLKHSTKASIRIASYEDPPLDETFSIIDGIMGDFRKFELKPEEHPQIKAIFAQYQADESKRYTKNRDLVRLFLNNIISIQNLYVNIGLNCAEEAFIMVRNEFYELQKKRIKFPDNVLAEKIFQLYESWLRLIESFFGSVDRNQPQQRFTKFDLLMEELTKKQFSENFCTIVFIQKRVDCQAIQSVVRKLGQDFPDRYGFIRSNYLVGASYDLTIDENMASHELQTRTLQSFRRGEYNVLFSTSVLEEGLDVPSCNLIIRFDKIQIHQSFIQSMGRARSEESEFVIFSTQSEAGQQRQSVNGYLKFNADVTKVLIENAECLEIDIKPDITDDELPPLCPGGTPESPRITSYDATSVVFQFCSKLAAYSLDMQGANVPVAWYDEISVPQSLLLQLSPEETKRYQASVVLPKKAAIKGRIMGEVMSTKSGAKRAAFLEVCRQLYAAGKLDENLRPIKSTLDEKVLREFQRPPLPDDGFPKKWYKTTTPRHLKCVAADKQIFSLYQLRIRQLDAHGQPTEPRLDHFKDKLFDYRSRKYSTGILSAVPLEMVPPLKLECTQGTLGVDLQCLDIAASPMTLSKQQRELLKKYQRTLFLGLLGFKLKHLHQIDNSPFWVVPIRQDSLCDYVIDYDVMKELEREYASGGLKEQYDTHVPENERILPNENSKFTGYDDMVVIPWCFQPQEKKENRLLFVAGVSEDMNENSPLNSGIQKKKDKSFKENLEVKYGVRLTRNGQKLLECVRIPNALDYLKPHTRRGLKEQERLRYIPESVRLFPLPASIITQAKMIPSILHRINRILLAMELGLDVSGDTERELRRPTYRLNDRWAYNEIIGEPNELPPELSKEQIPRFCFTKRHGSDYELNYQIVDERRRMMTSSPETYSNFQSVPKRIRGGFDVTPSCGDQDVLSFPPVYEILDAITTRGANDRLNLERMEVIGDSFLKYATTLCIYPMFVGFDEGKLTQIRSKVVCNENLKWLGDMKGIPGLLAGAKFDPENNCLPPSFIPNEKVALVAMKSDRAHDVLDGVDTEFIEHDTEENLIEYAKQQESSASSKRAFPGYAILKDKSVADCVESLIGAYYLTGGEASAYHVMDWFGIKCPDQDGNLVTMGLEQNQEKEAFAPSIASRDNADPLKFLPTLTILEELLNYKFKDPWLPVEALTHPNDYDNQQTDSFERLEFLGDAVLDFLITRHIYQEFLAKGPGEITDLRSALVNNVTFASLAVRNGFHKSLIQFGPNVVDSSIRKFVEQQQETGHQVTGHFTLLTENEVTMAQDIEVPKVLGDIFESLCGAVFIDTGMDLQKTWDCFFPLMKNEIESFAKKCPKSPIREVYERGYKVEVTTEESGRAKCVITVRLGDEVVHEFIGIGTGKRSAKDAAAKLTLRRLPNRFL